MKKSSLVGRQVVARIHGSHLKKVKIYETKVNPSYKLTDVFDAEKSFGFDPETRKEGHLLENKLSSRAVSLSFHAGKWLEKDMATP